MARDAPTLTKQRILAAAMKLADTTGIDKLTMRSLATELDVTPMSLYRYFKNKDALLDEMIDTVFSKMDVPTIGKPWRQEMHLNAHSTRHVLLAHTWALSLIETRPNAGPATLAHRDATIGTLLAAEFTMELVSQAFAVLDAYVYGFVLQEITLPFQADERHDETIQATLDRSPVAEAYPNLMALATQHLALPGYHFGDQFDFGLNLLLDGLTTHAPPQP